MIATDFTAAVFAALGTALLLGLASSCRRHAPATSRHLGLQIHAAGVALAALALWWPLHLSPGVSLLARGGWVAQPLTQLAPLVLAAAAWMAAQWWNARQWPAAAAAVLAALAAAWIALESDPLGTPALPLLAPALLTPILVSALMLTLVLRGTGRTQRLLRSASGVIAAATVAYGAWRSSAGALGAASDATDWLLLAGLVALGTLVVQLVQRAGDAVDSELPQAPRSRLAAVDGITGLPLRGQFEDRLARSMRECHAAGSTLAVMQINLDGFRQINETHGLQMGDLVLEHLAQRLRRFARSGDAIARLSGNDFLMLTTGVGDNGDADRFAVRLLEALAGPYRLEGVDVQVSCSVGVALWPGPSRATRLISSAEMAMREARRQGGARHCIYTPAMEANGSPDAELLQDLRNAIAANAFELHFQPKIDAHSGKITGAEALLRWQHPVRGLISPDEFVPLAERSGLIGPLGDWVIEESCRQSRVWRDAGLRMRVAINLSVFQMQQENLVQRIGEALQRHRVHPSLITCEITETAAMQDTRMAQETFRLLGAMGVHVSIDDFGTGYSSLAYLRKLPAEELKIDRAFVTDLDHSEDARAVVNAVVQLAHALSLKVVAEGVETARQRDILVELGCDELQGFLFAKPMPARLLLMWAMSDRSSSKAFKGSLFANTMEAPSRVASRLRAGRHLPVLGAVAEAAEADGELGPLPYSR